MKERTISNEALAILSQCQQDGQTIRIVSGTLARPLYEEVDYVLRAIGGKWNKKLRAHLFSESAEDVADMLEGCIQCGIAVPLRPGSYFPTPSTLGKRMVELAELKSGMSILEPSAGDGQLVETILVNMPPECRIYCTELDAKLYLKLTERYLHPDQQMVFCHRGDFLETTDTYDRIIMNPPFQKLQDVDHITHAWQCLKPGGRVISVASSSVTFRMEKSAVEFRELVKQHGRIAELPKNTFKPSGTSVNTVLVILKKDGPL